MNTDNTLNKFTLLVLSLILVCLVMLVIRAYQKPLPPIEQAAAPDAAITVIEEGLQARQPTSPLRPTNALRATPQHQPSPPAPQPIPEEPPPPLSFPETRPVVVYHHISNDAGKDSATSVGGMIRHQTLLFGFVNLVGTPKPEIPIDLGRSCGPVNPNKVTTRHFVVSPEGRLANVIVYLKQHTVPWKIVYQDSGPPPLLDQVGCMFEPYVMGVFAGQKFLIQNSDPVLHNIRATPKLNREFNFGQPAQGQVSERSFSRPEVFVRVKCDVHPWMFAYLGVISHPFFAVTDTNGVFQIPAGFPPGAYIVSAAHVKAGELTQDIVVNEGESKALQFTFSVDPAVRSQARVARNDVLQDATQPH